ncbi:lipopolysaccharide biosynthesis protein [Bradyrhizobium sp.]|uniref:lipopolysaccharide biosynthesis protein n=1 Tax=Bradyrhizobium sp. TaxID=376 RepID=UPI0039E41C82
MPEILTRSASNVRWVGTSQLIRLIIQLCSVALLSRLLAPSDYGLLAMAMVVTTFAGVLRDMGTANALIQKEELAPALLDTVFWFNIALGLACSACVAGASYPISIAFQEPRLQPVLIALAAIFPISASSVTQQTLMERASRFRDVALLEILSALLGFVAAVITAWCGWGVYSLVAQTFMVAAASTMQVWLLSGWHPTLRWDQEEFRGIWGFSGNLTVSNIVNYIAHSADTFLVGYFLGATELGWYNMTYRIALLPLQNLTYVTNRALFPVYARQSRTDLGRYYLKSLSLLALVTSPVILGLTAVRVPAVETLLGEKWMPVAGLLAWMCPTVLLHSLLSTTATILISIGRTDVLRNCTLLSSVFAVVAFVGGIPFGINGMAAAYFLATVPLFFGIFYITLKHLNLGLGELARCTWRPIAISLAMAAFVMVVDDYLMPHQFQAWVRLAILLAVGVVAYFALTILFLRNLLSQLKAIALMRSR